jgi:hypothetical protein
MSEPTSDLEKVNFKMKEKRRKDRLEKEREEEEYAENQQNTQNQGLLLLPPS